MTIEATGSGRLYTIGELAQAVGLGVHTLRWYEAQGLFPREIPRTSTGRRVFTEDSIHWVTLLIRLRESGMPVSKMAKYADLVRSGEGNEADRVALMESHAKVLKEKIVELMTCCEVIEGKITSYRELLEGRGVRIPTRSEPLQID